MVRTSQTRPEFTGVEKLPSSFRNMHPDMTMTPVLLGASDGAASMGLLYQLGDDVKTCVYLIHPRGECARHYMAPVIASRGMACFGHNSRYVNNDTDCLHENVLLDIAAGMRHLKELGFERIILWGNSGGGSLEGYYQAQASTPPAERIAHAPSGDPVNLKDEEMPEGDLFVAQAAHQGEGHFCLNTLDPSVVDESDPDSYDPDYDMFNPANGYREWPQPSRYDRDWLQRYRQAQRRRSECLDSIAREYIAERKSYQEIEQSAAFVSLDGDQQRRIQRRARLGKYMFVYRTLANPNYLDPTLDPSERPLGSIFAAGNPFNGNYGPGGLSRVMTPRGWLSTWSGTASYADLVENIQKVTLPTLIVPAAGDCDIYPSEQDELLEKSGAQDKQLITLRYATHYLVPLGEEGTEGGHPRQRLLDLVVPWVEERLGMELPKLAAPLGARSR